MRRGHATDSRSTWARGLCDVPQPGADLRPHDEQLCSADGAVLRVRQALLKSVREFLAGRTPALADHPDLDYRTIRSSAAC